MGRQRREQSKPTIFSSKASVTAIHSSNKRMRDVKSVATAKMLAKLVYSIDTSKVTEDGTEDENNSKEEESDNDGNPSESKKIAIEGMQIFVGKKKKAMPLKIRDRINE
jgi:hypothetical protein